VDDFRFSSVDVAVADENIVGLGQALFGQHGVATRLGGLVQDNRIICGVRAARPIRCREIPFRPETARKVLFTESASSAGQGRVGNIRGLRLFARVRNSMRRPTDTERSVEISGRELLRFTRG
jgi:hypothetical protein